MVATLLAKSKRMDFLNLALLAQDVDITGHLYINGNDISSTISGYLAGVTAGTVTASKALVVDASRNLSTTGINNLLLTGLFTESAADALTALTGGQAGALALTKEINRFTTVSAGFGAALPAAAPGLTIMVINSGANPLTVYGAGTDTIDDVATATGVVQMVGSLVIYSCTVASKWYTEGLGTGWSGALQTVSFADALTAVGTTQATGLQLANTLVRITTGASTTGVNLPTSAAGLTITIINSVANSIHVYPVIGGSETINGIAATTGIVQASNSVVTYYCTVAGTWLTAVPMQPGGAFASAANTTGFTATGAQVAGADKVILALTGTLGAGANIQLPTVAAMLAAIPAPVTGMTFYLRIANLSGAAFTWTVTTNTGWTLNNTMTMAQNFYREFLVTVTSVASATATIQSLGTTAQSAL